MGVMEEVYVKSYSYIFIILVIEEEIDDIFDWVDNYLLFEKKVGIIISYYCRLLKFEVIKKELYMVMVVSVFLESYLFYSGFFYLFYLVG